MESHRAYSDEEKDTKMRACAGVGGLVLYFFRFHGMVRLWCDVRSLAYYFLVADVLLHSISSFYLSFLARDEIPAALCPYRRRLRPLRGEGATPSSCGCCWGGGGGAGTGSTSTAAVAGGGPGASPLRITSSMVSRGRSCGGPSPLRITSSIVIMGRGCGGGPKMGSAIGGGEGGADGAGCSDAVTWLRAWFDPDGGGDGVVMAFFLCVCFCALQCGHVSTPETPRRSRTPIANPLIQRSSEHPTHRPTFESIDRPHAQRPIRPN